MSDARFMAAALALGRRHLGLTAPNPSVGALIVQGERIVGAGATAPGGRPHAETMALAEAGAQAKGATVYVTLEPCSHHGVTPPCAEALVAAGVGRRQPEMAAAERQRGGHEARVAHLGGGSASNSPTAV